jgi:hypothetical protein
LVTISDAQGAQSQLMQKISDQVVTPGIQTGAQPGSELARTELTRGAISGLDGYLSGGSMPTQVASSSNIQNYPALISSGGSPFSGIS